MRYSSFYVHMVWLNLATDPRQVHAERFLFAHESFQDHSLFSVSYLLCVSPASVSY